MGFCPTCKTPSNLDQPKPGGFGDRYQSCERIQFYGTIFNDTVLLRTGVDGSIIYADPFAVAGTINGNGNEIVALEDSALWKRSRCRRLPNFRTAAFSCSAGSSITKRWCRTRSMVVRS
jgi:hypothetical protein